MKLTCQQLDELLHDFVADELTVEQCEHVRIHMEACGSCRILVETYRITIKVCRKLPPRSLPTHLQTRLEDALKSFSNDQRGSTTTSHVQPSTRRYPPQAPLNGP